MYRLDAGTMIIRHGNSIAVILIRHNALIDELKITSSKFLFSPNFPKKPIKYALRANACNPQQIMVTADNPGLFL
jgi:hypothetical protein